MADRIPEQLIQDIIYANDIADLVGNYVSLKRSGASLIGLCPFHKEKTPSFHVTPERQLYYCFGCGAGGTVVDFVKNIENLDFVEAIRFLAERAGIPVSTTGFSGADRERYEKKQLILKMNVEAARFFRERLFSDAGAQVREYIKKRGLTKSIVNTYGLGYAPDGWDGLTNHLVSAGFKRELLSEGGLAAYNDSGRLYDRFRDRLMFPIIDVRGNILGFGGRAMGESGAKYLNSPETPVFNKRRNLFSLNFAKNAGTGELILVEGYMDVISLYQNGIKNAVASLGTALTQEQARLAARYAGSVVLCYDTDEAGVKAANRAIEVFTGIDVRLRVLNLPDGKDPDEFVRKNGAAAFSQLVKTADSVTGYRIMLLKNKYNIEDDNQKVELVNEAAKVLARVPNNIERDVFVSKLSDETGISPGAINIEIKRYAKKNVSKEKREAVKNSLKAAPSAVFAKNVGALLENAERQLVSLCVSDRRVFKRMRGRLEGLFTFEINQKIIEILSLDENAEAAAIVSRFSEDESAAAAAALSMPQNFEDNFNAAEELINTVEREKHNYLVKCAINDGDLDTLNRLIMERNKRDKERGELSG